MKTFITLVLAVLVAASTTGSVAPAARPSDPTAGESAASPVYVDSVAILYLERYPVQAELLVRGSLPTPCHSTAFEVQDLGDSIDVLLWSLADPETECITVLEPFDLAIPLGSFASTDLPVRLNGDEVGRIEIGVGLGEPSLDGAGWSFGFCLGYCSADLAFDGDDLVLTGRSRADDLPRYQNHGSLTPAGRARLGAALAELDDASLDPVYGCPDCADGGAAYLELSRDGVSERVGMEFGNPPDVLAGLYGVSASLIGALETCRSNELVEVVGECTVYQG